MFERILVGVDGSPDARRAGDVALKLAGEFSSHLTALFVADVRVVEGPAIETLAPMWGEVSGTPFQPEVLRAFQARGEVELERFARQAKELDLEAPDTVVEIGVAEEVLVSRAAAADLVVLGRRGENAAFGQESIGSTAARVVRRSPHPVLLGGESTALPERPLLAYDGGEPAMHTLDLAVRYAQATGAELKLVFAAPPSEDSVLATAEAMLEDHGVGYEAARIDAEPTEAIERAAEHWGCKCLFMGAFGHSRIHDLLFGSHTVAILETTNLPVFLTR
jgi:nucleotide-binding universal stress UspA family protein